MTSRWAKWLTCAALLAVSSLAEAAGDVAVLRFTGDKPKALQARVAKALEKAGASVTTDVRASADDAGALRKAGTAKGLAAFVSGDTQLTKKEWKLTLTVHGASGEVIDEVELKAGWLPGLLKKIDKEAADALEPLIERAQASAATAKPEPEPEAAESSEAAAPAPSETPEQPAAAAPEAVGRDEGPDEPEEPAQAGAAKAGAALELGAAVRGFTREFSYNQDVNNNLRPYGVDSPAIFPALFIAVGWYPGAHATRGFASDIGLVGDFERSLFASSDRESGSGDYSTTMQAFSAGLRVRFRFGDHQLGLSGRYGQHAFEVADDPDPTATVATGAPVERDLLPDVEYAYIRPGLDVRFRFDELSVGAYAGYRHVLSTGDLEQEQWFPEASATAADFGLFFGYALARSLDAMAGFEWRRYGVSMNSRPEDLAANRDVAGGALDQYLTGWMGVEWRLDGQ